MTFSKATYLVLNIKSIKVFFLFLLLCISPFSKSYFITFTIYLMITLFICIDFESFIQDKNIHFNLKKNILHHKLVYTVLFTCVLIIYLGIYLDVEEFTAAIYFIPLLLALEFRLSLNKNEINKFLKLNFFHEMPNIKKLYA